jgi:uncharacterized protein YdeI (YjbR/CyaY-like superfamily)
MEPMYFATAAEFRAWLEKHHNTERELWVGYYKKGSGRSGITYPESVDEALCFGWIDGVRRTVDDERYVNRFSPRTPRSNWSAVNIKRVQELTRVGKMHRSGLAAFAQRAPKRSEVHSYEQRNSASLEPEHERRFKANERAWEFFRAQPPGYRQTALYWVISAKKEETRLKRLATLIEDSAHGRRIGVLTRPQPNRRD